MAVLAVVVLHSAGQGSQKHTTEIMHSLVCRHVSKHAQQVKAEAAKAKRGTGKTMVSWELLCLILIHTCTGQGCQAISSEIPKEEHGTSQEDGSRFG